MNGFEDKRSLRALYVRLDRNSGSPTNREVQGDGVPIVLVGVTPLKASLGKPGTGERGTGGQEGMKKRGEMPQVLNDKPIRKLPVNWRAVCGESCKHGSEGGGWKRTVKATRWPPTLPYQRALSTRTDGVICHKFAILLRKSSDRNSGYAIMASM
jgi:hypothetical protein